MPIQSLLDNDLYKFTMGQAVAKCYPKAHAVYTFKDRDNLKSFSSEFIKTFKSSLENLSLVYMTEEEADFLRHKCPFIEEWYIQYLRSYRFNPNEVRVNLNDGMLSLSIEGPWIRTILWEIPLLALVSETYFQVQKSVYLTESRLDDFVIRTVAKRDKFDENKCKFADFGTRRRFSESVQKAANRVFVKSPNFVGTSNVYHALYFDTKPIGTMAHEWIMGVAALEGLRHANRHALKAWKNVYNGRLGIALTDTYGSAPFFDDFDSELARLFDGVRHDSGEPEVFIDSVVRHYKSLGLDPLSKTIVFSDSLNTDKAIKLKHLCEGRIQCSFGIGTHLTNDFPDIKPLNIVIKLYSLNHIPVAKLSDSPGKEMGDPSAIAEAQYVFRNKPIQLVGDLK